MSCARQLFLLIVVVIICALVGWILTLPAPSTDARLCPTQVTEEICFGGIK